jgi:hypothetical protein
MEPIERSLTALGQRVAGVQDTAPAAAVDHPRARGRLVSALRAPRHTSGPARWRAMAGAALAAAVVAALVLVFLRPRGSMHFEVGASEAGVIGAPIAAPQSSDLSVRFSDGSALGLAPNARLRVVALGPDGADVVLEKGEIEVSVVHREHTRWIVRVGPFQIDVVGTRFGTHWDPATESLEVVLHEGAVEVSGPILGTARRVNAGERLRVSTSTGRFDIASAGDRDAPASGATAAPLSSPSAALAGAEPPPQGSAAAPSTGASASTAGAPSLAPPTKAPNAAPPASSSWSALAREGKYKDALAAAVAEGFDGICATAPAAEVGALADTARLASDAARASQAMLALRQRFPGTPEAASVAFHHARSAQGAHDYAVASRWLHTYLAEQPNGVFAVEARGRLIEASDAAGDAAGARRAAEGYLAAHPNGPHAAFARSVLARETSPAP